MSEDRTTDTADDDELTFEVVKPLGGVISVRFNGEEMRQLREEIRRSDTTMSALIKQATLTHIAQRNLERGVGLAIQSARLAGTEHLSTTWLLSNFRTAPPSLNYLSLMEMHIDDGWTGFSLSGSMSPMAATTSPLSVPPPSEGGG